MRAPPRLATPRAVARTQGAHVTTEFYVNDAGNQFEALARSFEARVRQEFGEPAALPENGYPGEYLVDLAKAYRHEGGRLMNGAPEARAHRALRALCGSRGWSSAAPDPA